MDKFYALATPIRREILAILSGQKQLTATAIAEQFQVSPSAISQHLKILLNSDLVLMHKQAQQRIYELNTDAMQELEEWAHLMSSQIAAIHPQTPKDATKT
ncbi:MAG: metalloregulator ArsR/SmtB family transcription factor [Candidatus Saccharibacteria bacterium]|nr:metalloregulator ArsR/SmtB family transcription factor [Candidatus Saccharibacteria bacterium]